MLHLKISDRELTRRRNVLRGELEQRKLDGMVLYNPTSVFYLTNFAFIPTERPLALVFRAEDGFTAAFVPRLEKEHAEETGRFDRVEAYQEYPGPKHPMQLLAEFIKDLGLGRARLGADAPGYPGLYGYEGPPLSEVLPDATIENASMIIPYMRQCKSDEEIALIKESARWGNLAHRLLQEYVAPGRTETEISVTASHEASVAMIRTLGEGYEPRSWSLMGAMADFRGQIGPNSAHPHAITKNLRLKKGDVLVTGAAARVWGYTSELERTMFVGEPSKDQITYFNLMLEMQEIAFKAIRPGRPCSEVDKAVRQFAEENGISHLLRHHVGHNLGLEIHEAPFLDVGDDREIKPGMVFSVEPGLYVPGLGGFRHSDTVLVTEDGIEMITYYPRDLESMICPV